MNKSLVTNRCILIKSIACFFVFCLSGVMIQAQVKDRQFLLSPHSIQLSGYFENDIQNSINNWNKGVIPYTSFVDLFRNGRTQFALGEMWGKAVRSASMFYRYTRDPELKRILDETVRDLLSTQQPNGSISCSPPEKQPEGPTGDMWERKYVMLGLEDYYEWVNPDPAILESLIKQADCIIAQVGKAPKTEITDMGWSSEKIESSTLLEPIMRLYKLTGHQRHLDFATYIFESGGTTHYNVFEKAFDNMEPYKMAGSYPKAYEMTSLFEGLVEYYRVTKKPEVKQMLDNYFNNVRTKEITIIGNGGGDQPYHPKVMGEAWDNTAFEQTNPDIKRMMETCVGVTWMKFCSQMLRLTGDSAPADEIEKYICNGLLGAMKPTGDGFSYVNLLNGKKVNDHGWGCHFDKLHVTCCNLSGPIGLSYIPFIAVTGSVSGPVVNLYNAAELTTNTPAGQTLKMKIDTDYPQSGKIKIHVNPEKSEKFSVHLRIPAWSEKNSVRVNGKKQKVESGQYAVIEQEWKKNDLIEIEFEMICRVVDAPKGSNRKGDNFQAVMWGPIVLARDENIDPEYNQPVKIKADKQNIVKISKTKPTRSDARMEFIVPTTKGNIRMVDYASVNGWNGSQVCTWLPLPE